MSRLDVAKISDSIELLRPLDADTVARVLRVAYEHWIGQANYRDVPGAGNPDSDKLGFTRANELLHWLRSRDRTDPLSALTTLVSTPRALKRLVHDVDRVWAQLRGESELADIIVVYALRNAVPPVIDFIDRNIDAARMARDNARRLMHENQADRIETEWQAVLSRIDHPRETQALVDLLGITRLMSDRIPTGRRPPQDVANYEVTDYFRRILAGALAPDEISDRVVIQDIVNWKARVQSDMIPRLVAATEGKDRYARKWEQFAEYLLDREQLLRVASELHLCILQTYGAASSFRGPSATAAWRLASRTIGKDTRTDWLIEEIRMALPASLAFACELYYFYGSASHSIVSEQGRALVRAAFVDSAREIYTDAPALIRALSPDQPYAIPWFIHPPPHDEPPDPMNLKDLRWLASILIEAAALAPSLIVPGVAVAFGHVNRDLNLRRDEFVTRYQLDKAAFEEFFGVRTDEMLRNLLRYPNDPADEHVELARPQVQEWLRERSEGPERDPAGWNP